ncbi:hypothetical protein ACFSC4_30700 [Deinococcus malanensis]
MPVGPEEVDGLGGGVLDELTGAERIRFDGTRAGEHPTPTVVGEVGGG